MGSAGVYCELVSVLWTDQIGQVDLGRCPSLGFQDYLVQSLLATRFLALYNTLARKRVYVDALRASE